MNPWSRFGSARGTISDGIERCLPMEPIKKQVISELKHLPCTLCKLVGGIMAVIGFPCVIIISRKSDSSYGDMLPCLLVGILGVSLFWLSSIVSEKRISKDTDFAPTPQEKRYISILAWLLFLIFIAILIVITFILTM